VYTVVRNRIVPDTLKEPNPQEYHKHQTQKYHKRKPAHPLSLRHSLHPSHRSIQIHPRIRKIIILQSKRVPSPLKQGDKSWGKESYHSIHEARRISNFLADFHRHLRSASNPFHSGESYIFEHADFLEESFYHVIVL